MLENFFTKSELEWISENRDLFDNLPLDPNKYFGSEDYKNIILNISPDLALKVGFAISYLSGNKIKIDKIFINPTGGGLILHNSYGSNGIRMPYNLCKKWGLTWDILTNLIDSNDSLDIYQKYFSEG